VRQILPGDQDESCGALPAPLTESWPASRTPTAATRRPGCRHPVAADVVNLHFFVGMTLNETAEALGVSRATVYRHWAYARALLRLALRDCGHDPSA